MIKVHARAQLPQLLADTDCVEGTVVGRDLMDTEMARCLGGPCTLHFEHSQLQVRQGMAGRAVRGMHVRGMPVDACCRRASFHAAVHTAATVAACRQVREKALGGKKVLPRLVEQLVRTKQYVRLREMSEVLHLGPVLKSPDGKLVDYKTDT